MRKLDPKLVEAVKDCQRKGMFKKDVPKALGLTPNQVRAACANYNITGWAKGAAARDQRGFKNPNYIVGRSRSTIGRRSKEAVINSGRDLFTCEKCGVKREIAHPRHHKDRNCTNNTPDNVEVLCVPCHMLEHKHERIRGTSGRFIA